MAVLAAIEDGGCSAWPIALPAAVMSFDPYSQWLGIPADQRPPDHYQLLGLTQFDPDVDTIKAAAIDRMAAVRRYQLGQHSETAVRLMGELARAFDCLTDPVRRAAYDEELFSRNGDDEWFCQVMGEELGPMTRADLDQMIEQRRVTPHDLVRNGSGASAWHWPRSDS